MTADARCTLLQGSCFMEEAARQQDSLQDTEKVTDKLPLQVDSLKFPALFRSLDTHYSLWAEEETLQKNFG